MCVGICLDRSYGGVEQLPFFTKMVTGTDGMYKNLFGSFLYIKFEHCGEFYNLLFQFFLRDEIWMGFFVI